MPDLPPTRPMLVVLRGAPGVRPVRLHTGRVVIGRGEQADLQVDGDGVSRTHAEVRCTDDGHLTIRDLGSTNGTWLGATRLDGEEHDLHCGDRIAIPSDTVIKVVRADEHEEQFLNALYTAATRDPLTGLHNRFALQDTLHREACWHRRRGSTLSLVLVDLDGFKEVNDTYGHLAGDRVLERIGRLFLDVCRTEDTVSRFGGDEFVILARDTEPGEARQLAERLRTTLARAVFPFGNDLVRVTASFGVVAMCPQTPCTPGELLELADEWMYVAKKDGKDRVASPIPAPKRAV